MSNRVSYGKKLLLIEDRKEVYGPLVRWLKQEGYQVRLATTYEEAQVAIVSEHYHLALVDIRLDENDKENIDGIRALEAIRDLHPSYDLPCIVLTAYSDVDRVLLLFQEFSVYRYIKKRPNYWSELSMAIEDCFAERVRINFEMEYLGESAELVESVAKHVRPSLGTETPQELLVQQIYDLLGQLFSDAAQLDITPLKPGMTGAAVVRAKPTWSAGVGNAYVVKIGRLDAIAQEHSRYETEVHRYVPANTVAQLGVKYARDVGVLLYSFAQNSNAPMEEFDNYYRNSSPKAIIASLNTLFMETCRHWFKLSKPKQVDLPRRYFEGFELTMNKLINRIQIVLPAFDPRQPTYALSDGEPDVINPIYWLRRHYRDGRLLAYCCITHGDMTGRNVMVDENGRCWLIDFFRTGESHLLRDFVVLETDIKYRLLALTSISEFLQFELLLYQIGKKENLAADYETLSEPCQKAFQVIAALRQMAVKLADPFSNDGRQARLEYLMALLVTTLNIVRIRGYNEQQKRQAMRSAAIICAELDELAGRKPISVVKQQQKRVVQWPSALGNGRSKQTDRLKASAQMRTLTKQLAEQNLMLFVGSNAPRDVSLPNNLSVAHQLMQEINHQPSLNDSSKKLFTLYLNESGMKRGQLIDRLVGYFASQPLPALFQEIPNFDWVDLFTTNQHTYLEQAYAAQKRPLRLIITTNDYRQEKKTRPLLFKLNGALTEQAHKLPVECLPLTEYDYEWPTMARLNWFWDQMQRKWQNGRSLLMLFATEEEIMTVRRRYKADAQDGLVWVAGAAFSREEQEIYRNLGLRILPESELDLLSTLKALRQ